MKWAFTHIFLVVTPIFDISNDISLIHRVLWFSCTLSWAKDFLPKLWLSTLWGDGPLSAFVFSEMPFALRNIRIHRFKTTEAFATEWPIYACAVVPKRFIPCVNIFELSDIAFKPRLKQPTKSYKFIRIFRERSTIVVVDFLFCCCFCFRSRQLDVCSNDFCVQYIQVKPFERFILYKQRSVSHGQRSVASDMREIFELIDQLRGSYDRSRHYSESHSRIDTAQK